MRAAARAQRLGYCSVAVCAVILVCIRIVAVNTTTVALSLLLVVLGAATRWGLTEAIYTSVVAVLAFNFFFLPPVGTLTIADPENWIALFVFLATAFTVSQLSARAKERTEEAVAGRNELEKLYELSRAMLMDETRDAIRLSVSKISQILQLTQIAFFDAASGEVCGTLDNPDLARQELIGVAETGEPAGGGDSITIPVRMGTQIIGSLALRGAELSPTIRNSVASLLAINYERVRALDRAAAAEVARRNEQFKSSLLDGLAHDLKTPLTAIRTCVTRLISIPPRTEEVRQELLSIIDQESLRLQKSITEAIQLARVESESLHLNRELTNIAELAYSVIAETRDENHARYTIDIASGMEFEVDVELIRRALLQILENARKYAPPDSPIRIAADIEDGQAIVSVSDTGPGFRHDEIEKVFDKFHRGRAGSANVEGTGMGLAIARGIIEAHGGRIRAGNRPGGGAIVSFTLPVTVGTQ